MRSGDPHPKLNLSVTLASSPRCGMSSGCKARKVVAHLDQSQFDKFRQVIFVDYPRAVRGDVLQRPSQINGVEPEASERVRFLIHWLCIRVRSNRSQVNKFLRKT